MRRTENYPRHLIFLGFFVLVILVFWPAITSDFVNWDDQVYIEENKLVHQLSFENVTTMFTKSHEVLYQPLALLGFAIEYQLFKQNPMGYHIVNILLHAINGCLVFVLFYRLSKRNSYVAIAVALLFLVHPLHVESVAWITEFKDLIFSFFYFLSILSFLKFRDEQSQKFFAASLVFCLLALFSKVLAITIPAVLTLIDWYEGRSWKKSIFENKYFFWLVAFVFGCIALVVHFTHMDYTTHAAFNLWQRLAMACYAFLFYFYKMLWPFNLSCARAITPETYNGSLIFYFVGLTVLFFVVAYKNKRAIFCFLFYVITVAPTLPTQVSSIVADRFSYLPLLGWFFLGASGAADWMKNDPKRKRLVMILTASIIIALSLVAHARTKVWKNGVVLWSDVLRRYPSALGALNNLGVAYEKQKEYDKAIENFTRVIELDDRPDNFDPTQYSVAGDAYQSRGNIYFKLGLYEKAIKDYTRALELSPKMTQAIFNRANAYRLLGKESLALEDFDRAIKSKPNAAEFMNNRGLLYYDANKFAEAEKDFDAAITLNPKFADTYNNRGVLKMNTGDISGAEADFRKAIEYRSDFASAYNNLGTVQAKSSNWEGAFESFSKAIKANPDYFEAYYNRGNVKAIGGNFESALEDFKKALQLKPDSEIAQRKIEGMELLIRQRS